MLLLGGAYMFILTLLIYAFYVGLWSGFGYKRK